MIYKHARFINNAANKKRMVRLICYNIEYCEGIEGHWYQYLKFWKIFFPPKGLDQKIVGALKNVKPDILALVEVDTGSFRAKKDEVFFFADKLRLNSVVEKVKYPLHSWLGLFHHIPLLRKQANAILTKYNINRVRYHILHEGMKRVVIEADIHCPKKLSLLLVHLSLGGKERAKQIEELIRIVNSIKNPVMLMGDFNTFKGKEEIENLLNKTHLKDSAKLDKSAEYLTHPSWHPMRRLDYVLVSSGIKVKKYSVLKFHFSDHLPLFVEFVMK
jgi:endonuclease/exonuclease/phosphatase family metal-dependent hydrolase